MIESGQLQAAASKAQSDDLALDPERLVREIETYLDFWTIARPPLVVAR
jgi:hypothetical protein